MEALQLDARYAASRRGAGAGGWGLLWNADLKGSGGWAYSSPLSIFKWACSLVLDSHYAGRRVIGCRRCQSRSSPRAKNTGVECECISNIFLPAKRTTCINIKTLMTTDFFSLYCYIHDTYMSLSSPLRGHIAVAGCARRPICRHRDWMGGNRHWRWSCQQSS